jgi:uncharacterized OB-fold protein
VTSIMLPSMPSPHAIFSEHCRRGELAYQVTSAGEPVFYPRLVAPRSGETDLAWRISAGLGTVHATTVVRRRGEEPLNVALVDLDEGFRMMSRVETVAPEDVRIGLRVRVSFDDAQDPPLPVFVPA